MHIGKICRHTSLNEFTNDVFCSIDKPKTKVGAIFIDFTKAFDNILIGPLIAEAFS